MAGANPYGVSENDSIKSKRYSSNRAVGFAGGAIDSKTGNLTPASEAATAGQQPSPIESVQAEPIVQTEYVTKEAPKYLPDIAGVSHQTADPVDESIRQRVGEIDQHLFRVICTELHRTGEMPRDLYAADMRFTAKYLSATTIRGYHWWAIPCVRQMRKRMWLRGLMAHVATARAEELGRIMGIRQRHNWLGKLVRLIGEPSCFLIGLVVKSKPIRAPFGTPGETHVS